MNNEEKIDVLLSWIYEHCENDEEYLRVLQRLNFPEKDIEIEEDKLR